MRKRIMRPTTREALVAALLALTTVSACKRGETASLDSSAAAGISPTVRYGPTADRLKAQVAIEAAAPPSPTDAPMAASMAASVGASTANDPQENLRLAGSLSTPSSGAVLVRQAQAAIEVRSLDKAVAAARATASRFGGFVANTAIQGGREQQRAASLQEQIERYDARVRYLEKRSAMSTLELSLQEPLPLIERPQSGILAEALATARDRTLWMMAWCIASLGTLVPLVLLIGAAWLVAKRLTRRVPPATA